ncbi:unnamed protein product [Arctia plantaginis]|uniref:Uncharacterized protein n=1 Tax=Arctia plantaginis TaxID=874455 RepID=A0A8S0ZGS8_ARCPL|nr:unnamed protein product [Arctia plantaginis]
MPTVTGRLRPPACSVVVSVHAEPVLLSPPLTAEKLAPIGPHLLVFYRGFLLHAPKSEEPAGQPADTPTLLDQALPESR